MENNNTIPKCPHLRFPEFNDEWKQIPNKQLFAIANKRNSDLQRELVLSASQSLGMTCREKIGIDIKYKKESISTYKLVDKGDYIIHLRSFQGGFAFSDIDGVCSPAYTILRPIGRLYYGFFKEYFRSTSFINSLALVTYGIRDGRSISVEEWMLGNTMLPSLAEQGKIASFLSLLDERIEAQRQIIKERKNQKKALLSQIFSQALRFPGFSDEWQQTTLGEVAERVTRKNSNNITLRPLTISAQYGLIDQRDFFDKVVASSNLEGYHLLKKGEFAYNRSSSSNYPWGAIKRLEHYNEGALSTLYICFSLKYEHPVFFSYFFETTNWYNHIQSVSAEGARNHGLLNIAVSDFFGLPIFLPSLPEQQKIATFLSLLDTRIEVEEELLQKYEEQKKYLLRVMFV